MFIFFQLGVTECDNVMILACDVFVTMYNIVLLRVRGLLRSLTPHQGSPSIDREWKSGGPSQGEITHDRV